MKLSIVTACYYNEQNLEDTYQEIRRSVFDAAPEYDWEWILVDDGSGDGTLEVAKALRARDDRIRIVKFSRNFGELRAIVAGLSVAEGEAVAVISADLQDPPSLILRMVESWRQGNKVNLAVRKGRDEASLKNWFADTYYRMVRRWLMPNYPKRGFDFFLLDRAVALRLVEMQEKNSSLYLQVIWLGYRPAILEYTRRDRDKGVSMWTYGKRFNLFVDTFIVFSNRPIRLMTALGGLLGLTGFVLGLILLIRRLGGQAPSGWAWVAALILLSTGLQMGMTGILGEYIWRNLDESRKRPLYVIEEVIPPLTRPE